MGLLYGTGNITRQELSQLDTPEANGPWHRPVPFGDYIDMVTDSLIGRGATIVSEEFQLTNNSQRFFGAMQIRPKNVDTFLPGTGTDLIVGLRGSHDKIVPRGICIGTRVMVCSNLCFDGDMGNLKTRQTTNVMERLPVMITSVVGEIDKIVQTNVTRIEAYKNHNVKTSQAGDAVIVDLFRREVINLQQMQTALGEWIEPSFGEHQSDGDYTAWSVFNSVTQAFKPVGQRAANQYNHAELNRRSTQLVESLDQIVGLKKAA
jgi:hypothetical protein